MLPVNRQYVDGMHCFTDADLRNLLINLERKDTHIEILEGYIDAARSAR